MGYRRFSFFVLACVVTAVAVFAMRPHAAMAADPAVPKAGHEYLELPALTLPIITDRGPTQQLSIVVSIEVPSGKLAEVENYAPRLSDAYLSTLYGSLGAGHYIMSSGLIDIQSIKDRLHAVTASVLKEEMFTGILLQMVQQRQLY